MLALYAAVVGVSFAHVDPWTTRLLLPRFRPASGPKDIREYGPYLLARLACEHAEHAGCIVTSNADLFLVSRSALFLSAPDETCDALDITVCLWNGRRSPSTLSALRDWCSRCDTECRMKASELDDVAAWIQSLALD